MDPKKSRAADLVAASLENRILTVRGRSVMIDADLAELYGSKRAC